MDNDFQEVEDVIEVPPNTGESGFIHTIRTYLRMPRVQEINIDSRGRVRVRRYAKKNDSDRNIGMDLDFGELQPHGIVRNTRVEEVSVYEGANAAVVLGGLLDLVAVSQLKPLAFLTGADSVLWEWYRLSTGVALKGQQSVHGLPVYTDRALPDTALILASGYGRDAALVDTRLALKIEMPVHSRPETTVEIFP
jgi:hypothetical protein